jgi:hypothetical protein
MKHRGALWVHGVLAAMVIAVPAWPAAPAAPAGGAAPKVKSVTFHVFHRVFQNFQERVATPMKQDFRVGDTEHTARVVEWVPDFTMDLKTRKITTRGPEPKNPAFRIVVRKGGVPQDTVWAFFNMPPHFAAKSLVGFMATDITFLDHAPMQSQDSLAVRLREAEKEKAK